MTGKPDPRREPVVHAHPSQERTHAVAWAGVGFDVPGDWNFAAAEGDFDRGYFRLDDPTQVRMEVRWEYTTPPDRISDLTDRYLRRLTKAGHLSGPRAVRRDTRILHVPDAELETFAWRGPADVIGMAMRCRLCNRSILVRLTAGKSESALVLARRVFGSVRDYACIGQRAWSVLDFRFDAPEAFRCERHSLRAGRLEFEFRCGRTQLKASRTSLAETILRTQSLAEWARDENKGGKRDRAESVEREFKGHPACDVEGVQRTRVPLIGRRAVHALAWHCPESNCLYLARQTGPATESAPLERFAESFRCH